MSKTMNKNEITLALATEVEVLSDARMHWENGSLKSSNTELYQLLQSCVDFYLDIRSQPEKCKALDIWLSENGIQCNMGTGLRTRIVRAVFGADCGRRAYTYTRVITVAADEKSPEMSMSDFVTGRGGIEEIRRTKPNGQTPTMTRKDKVDFAIGVLETSAALAPAFEVKASTRKPPEDITHVLFAALMRQEADGSCSMVYETSTKSVVNTVLEHAGKDQSRSAENVAVLDKQRSTSNDVANSTARAIAAGSEKEAA
jgi:hypothetical protein